MTAGLVFSSTSALTERRYKALMRFFHTFRAVGLGGASSSPSPVRGDMSTVLGYTGPLRRMDTAPTGAQEFMGVPHHPRLAPWATG